MQIKNNVALSIIAIFAILAAAIAGYSLVKLEDNDAEMVESIREQQRSPISSDDKQQSLSAPLNNTKDLGSTLNLEAIDEENLIDSGDIDEAIETELADEFGQSYVENEF